MENDRLERELSAAFRGGEVLCRELRLTDEQARELSERFPAAVEPLGEQWYRVSFPGPLERGA